VALTERWLQPAGDIATDRVDSAARDASGLALSMEDWENEAECQLIPRRPYTECDLWVSVALRYENVLAGTLRLLHDRGYSDCRDEERTQVNTGTTASLTNHAIRGCEVDNSQLNPKKTGLCVPLSNEQETGRTQGQVHNHAVPQQLFPELSHGQAYASSRPTTATISDGSTSGTEYQPYLARSANHVDVTEPASNRTADKTDNHSSASRPDICSGNSSLATAAPQQLGSQRRPSPLQITQLTIPPRQPQQQDSVATDKPQPTPPAVASSVGVARVVRSAGATVRNGIDIDNSDVVLRCVVSRVSPDAIFNSYVCFIGWNLVKKFISIPLSTLKLFLGRRWPQSDSDLSVRLTKPR
jgi:hypothetical protein